MNLDLLGIFTGAESLDEYDSSNEYLSDDMEQQIEEPLEHPDVEVAEVSVEFEDVYDPYVTPEEIAEEVAQDGFTVDSYTPDEMENEYAPEATDLEVTESIPDEFGVEDNQADSSFSDIIEENVGVSLNEEGLANVGQYNTVEENEEVFAQEGIAGYDIYDEMYDENGFDHPEEGEVSEVAEEASPEEGTVVEELGFVEEGSSFVEDVDMDEYEAVVSEFEEEHAEELSSYSTEEVVEEVSEEAESTEEVSEVAEEVSVEEPIETDTTEEAAEQTEIQEEREASGEEMETEDYEEIEFEEDFAEGDDLEEDSEDEESEEDEE